MQVSEIHEPLSITIFTDGSCHSRSKAGGWAAMILIGENKIMLTGSNPNTTHHRMELTAVLESLSYVQQENLSHLHVIIYSDSQYVVDMLGRRGRLISSEYKTRQMKPVRNSDLVRHLMQFIQSSDIQFQKIKSHQKIHSVESLHNREVDFLSRQKMRELNDASIPQTNGTSFP
jgi:ribonuclease HI